jgi:uncharacterized protein (DUF885 family)
MDEYLSWDPSYATQLGWGQYDSEMRDPSPEAYAHQVGRLNEFIAQLQEFGDDALSEDELLDRDLAVSLFRVRVFEIEKLRLHERMPIAMEEIGVSLFFLITREHRPLDKKIDAITSRLEKIPEYLEKTRATLTRPCRMWVEIAIETGKRLPPLLDQIEKTAREHLGANRSATMLTALERARIAIDRHVLWLESEVLPMAEKNYSQPAGFLEEYMILKGCDVTPDEAVELAEAHLAKIKSQMESVARKIAPHGSLQEALEKMRSSHPDSFDEVLRLYRETIENAREFLIEKDLATIPSNENLRIIETPIFLRHLAPFASQYEPGKYTPDRTGLFLVTPDDNPEMLKDHAYSMIINTAVHEGYPGHHLQGICSNTHPSHIRSLSASMDFGEGWALYCEELMIDQGYNDTPQGRLAQLNDLIFRVVRVVIDVKLARGEMDAEEAAQILTKEVGMTSGAAINEARSYTYCPTYYLAYFLGKLQLLRLLEDVKKAMAERFSLKFFHDALLYAGCLPMQFMRRELSTRLKVEFGIVLPEPAESLYEFAMRTAKIRP